MLLCRILILILLGLSLFFSLLEDIFKLTLIFCELLDEPEHIKSWIRRKEDMIFLY